MEHRSIILLLFLFIYREFVFVSYMPIHLLIKSVYIHSFGCIVSRSCCEYFVVDVVVFSAFDAKMVFGVAVSFGNIFIIICISRSYDA